MALTALAAVAGSKLAAASGAAGGNVLGASIASGAASGVASNVLGGPSDSSPGETSGVTQSGNTLGNSVSNEKQQQWKHEIRIAEINAGVRPRSSEQTVGNGKVKKLNTFLGSNVGKVASTIGTGLFNDFRGRRNRRNYHEFLSSKGLTPVEIAGTAGAATSGASGSAPNLTNIRESAKERSIKSRQAAVAEGKLEMERFKFPEEFAYLTKRIESLDEDILMKRIQREDFWAIRLSHMGLDNMLAAVAMAGAGASPRDILRAVPPATDEQAQALQDIYEMMLLPKSALAREFLVLFGMSDKLEFKK